MIWNPDKSVIKEVCLGAEFLQRGRSYEEADKYIGKLMSSGYDFKVLDAVKRRQYGYDVKPHELCIQGA